MQKDTITAISTPPGNGGIHLVRLSGSDAVTIVRPLFKGKTDLKKAEPNRAYHGWIVNQGESVDEVVVSLFKNPNSYTGEDVIEISCHGGTFVSQKILELCVEQGARPADPGEFTLRAFLNNRMDLAQAEAVADLIHAKTEASRRVATYQLEGRLSDRLSGIRNQLMDGCSLLEIELDFSEEDIKFASRDNLSKQLASAQDELSNLLQSFQRGRVCRDGVRMAIVGRPNVGKSSLLNALVERERAIVTEHPGTTRDIVEDVLDVEGVLFRIIDTAGIRDTNNPMEQEGVSRAEKAMSQADVVLLVLDSSEALTNEDSGLIDKANKLKSKTVVVLNKSDLKIKIDSAVVQDLLPGKILKVVSALKQAGVTDLIDFLKNEVLSGDLPVEGEVVVTRERHRKCIQDALDGIGQAKKSLDKAMSQEFVVLDLRGALDKIGEITGEVTTDDILNRIFSEFCIGK